MTEIKFIEYSEIEGYIELMKHDVEPLNNPECRSISLCYDGKDIKALLDYITNLQQDNISLVKNNIISDSDYFRKMYNLRKEIDILKSRIDKAIEYIMENLITEWDIKNDGYVSGSDLPADAITPILNILNGSDDNEDNK